MNTKPTRESRRTAGMVAVLLLAGGVSLHAARTWSTPQNQAPATGAKTSQAPASKMVCPEGQVVSKVETPFGPVDACVAGAAPVAPPTAPTTQPPVAQAPAANKAPAPDSSKQSTQPATKPEAPKSEAPAAAQPAPGEKKAEENDKELKDKIVQDGAIALNLENADLYQVLRILGPELKINTIIDPAVRGTVTINTSTTVSRKDLFGLLEMILEINGATAVRQPNGYYAIVPLGNAKQEPLDFHYEKKGDRPPSPDEAFTLRVIPMKFMPASEMSKILTPYMSAAGQIVVQDKGNLLLISDSAAKLQQLQEIINVFDDPVLGRQRVHLFPVKNNLAANLIPELKSIFAGYGLTQGNTAIQFVPMQQQNSILAISAAPEIFNEVGDWIDKLDQPSQSVGVRNFVYKVQNAKAIDLAGILIELYGGGPYRSGSNTGLAPVSMNNARQLPNPATVMGPQIGAQANTATSGVNSAPANQPQGTSDSGIRMEGGLRIMPDEKNNSLIIQATPHDYSILQETLQEIDVLPRQVLIDAHIYEVDLTGDLSLGISAFLDKNKTPINTNASFSSATGFQFQTFAILHNVYQLQTFLNASENRTRVKTLSAPSILVTDNTQARVQVGAEVPVPIGSALTPVQSGGNSIFAQTIEMRDTGVILTVTPRINASGIVTLEIGQEVSQAQPNGTSAIVAPVINKSMFQTTAVLRDGQTLALGGIITTNNNLTKNRIPLLGDIPGIGALLGSTSLSTSRKELVLMITPHVAQDMNDAHAVSADFVNSLKNLKKDLPHLPGPPITQ